MRLALRAYIPYPPRLGRFFNTIRFIHIVNGYFEMVFSYFFQFIVHTTYVYLSGRSRRDVYREKIAVMNSSEKKKLENWFHYGVTATRLAST